MYTNNTTFDNLNAFSRSIIQTVRILREQCQYNKINMLFKVSMLSLQITGVPFTTEYHSSLVKAKDPINLFLINCGPSVNDSIYKTDAPSRTAHYMYGHRSLNIVAITIFLLLTYSLIYQSVVMAPINANDINDAKNFVPAKRVLPEVETDNGNGKASSKG